MNLVALEYIASQNPSNPGSVLLSEFTGAISTLSHVIPINPWDVLGTSRQLAFALSSSSKDRVSRHAPMLEYLKSYTATNWAESFMSALQKQKETLTEPQIEISVEGDRLRLEGEIQNRLNSRPLVAFLDFDGTLAPIVERPEDAKLSTNDREMIEKIVDERDGIELVIVSGRDSKFLEKQFKGVPITMAAEHGARYYDLEKKKWVSRVSTDYKEWYTMARKIMEDYARRVPGSLVERKSYSISWHYRNSPSQFASYESRKLREELEVGLSNLPVTILSGKKVVEARAVDANKGSFCRWYLNRKDSDSSSQVLAIGDDETDEDVFRSLPKDSVTIKVGEGKSSARYRVWHQSGVRRVLRELMN